MFSQSVHPSQYWFVYLSVHPSAKKSIGSLSVYLPGMILHLLSLCQSIWPPTNKKFHIHLTHFQLTFNRSFSFLVKISFPFSIKALASFNSPRILLFSTTRSSSLACAFLKIFLAVWIPQDTIRCRSSGVAILVTKSFHSSISSL